MTHSLTVLMTSRIDRRPRGRVGRARRPVRRLTIIAPFLALVGCSGGGDGRLDATDTDASASSTGPGVDSATTGGAPTTADDGMLDATTDSTGSDDTGTTTDGSDSSTAGSESSTGEPLMPPDATMLELTLSPVKQFDFSWAEAEGADSYQLLESFDTGEPFVPVSGTVMETSLSLTVPLHLRTRARYMVRACNADGCTDSAPVDVTGPLLEAIGYFKATDTTSPMFRIENFGQSVALSADGSTLAVGAYGECSSATGIDGDQADNSACGSGAVTVFTRDPAGQWSQKAYIKASNTDADDWFGVRVVLSASGDTLAVGAELEASNGAGVDGDQLDNSVEAAGAAYVFARDGMGQWSQQAYIKSPAPDIDDYFGTTVALSGDGDTLAVGASYEDGGSTGIGGDPTDDSVSASGAAYVFTRDGMGQWSQQAYIKASNAGELDLFGARVALDMGGDTLMVSAIGEGGASAGVNGDPLDDSLPAAGAVYAFARDGMGQWSQQAYIKASNPGGSDRFGVGLALSHDGCTMVVSAMYEQSGATGIDGDQLDDSADYAGAAYAFVCDGMGSWTQQAYIKASNTEANDIFGIAVALSGDGDTLAVGAQEASLASGLDGDELADGPYAVGAAYVYARDGMGQWAQRAYVKASNASTGDDFGRSVALSGDGQTLAVGAIGEDGGVAGIGGDPLDNSVTNAGAVYLY